MNNPDLPGSSNQPPARSRPAAPAGTRSTATNQPETTGSAEAPAASRVWLWIVVAFAVQVAAWTTWLAIASHHRVAEVPIAGAAGGGR